MANRVTRVEFPMNEKPKAVQLTTHVNNLLNTYDKTTVIKGFKSMLYTEKTTEVILLATRQIVNHYGIDYCQQWFTEVYGWNFNKEAV